MTATSISRRQVLGLGAAFLLSGCSAPVQKPWTLGGGEAGGFFGEFARLLADAAVHANSPVRFEPVKSSGSLENVQGVLSGKLDFALALGDSIGNDLDGIRSVARVYQTYWQLLTVAGSPVDSAKQLAGQRVSLGPQGSGTQFTARRILKAANLGPSDFTEVPLTVADSAEALANGDIDAALVAGGLPLPLMKQTLGKKARLVSLAAETHALVKSYGPEYFPVSIPADVYDLGSDVPSLGVSSLLICSSSLPDDVVREALRLLIDYPGRLVPEEALGTQYLDPRSMIYTPGIKLHPGAQELFRQRHG